MVRKAFKCACPHLDIDAPVRKHQADEVTKNVHDRDPFSFPALYLKSSFPKRNLSIYFVTKSETLFPLAVICGILKMEFHDRLCCHLKDCEADLI